MARSQGIPGIAVVATAAGTLLTYCGIKDVPVIDALRAILRGQLPQPRTVQGGPTDAQIADLIESANRSATLPPATRRDPNAPGLK